MMHVITISACTLCATTAWGTERTDLVLANFMENELPSQLVPNSQFLPTGDADAAHEEFIGTIRVAETPMTTDPAEFENTIVLGKDVQIFPAVEFTFITVDDDLVPETQDVMRYGSLPGGESYWDIIVQAGAIWSEPEDDGWSRASFPFALMHSLEGETHNGVAMFLYRGSDVSDLHFQIVAETAPFYVEEPFTAVGTLSTELLTQGVPQADEIERVYRLALAHAEPARSWAELEELVGARALAQFDTDIDQAEVIADGIGLDGDFYLRGCPTIAGELPYCERQRFGVWSATKSTSNTLALLYLAQRYGREIMDERVSEYVPETRGIANWDSVTFGDLVNLSSGMGYGSTTARPYNSSEPFPGEYYAWYEAPTVADKLNALLEGASAYPWMPGEVMRYRDEDMFLLGVAMTRFINAQGESYPTIWDMLEAEVYEPLGIYYAPTNKTIEEESVNDQPLMAFGFYPTIGDLAKIARFYQNYGVADGRQMLDPVLVSRVMPSAASVGLPTGQNPRAYYTSGFWWAHLDSRNGCSFYYPSMTGFGGILLPIFSSDTFALRITNNTDGSRAASRMESLEYTADRVADLCR